MSLTRWRARRRSALTAFLRQRADRRLGPHPGGCSGYADDFRGRASLDAVTSTFVAAGSYRFSDQLEVGLGAAVQNVFGEPLPMPVASRRLDDHGPALVQVDPAGQRRADLAAVECARPARLAAGRAAATTTERRASTASRNPQLNYSAVAADLGARWFVLPFLHLTAHGGYTLYRRFEFSEGRDPVPGGEVRSGQRSGVRRSTSASAADRSEDQAFWGPAVLVAAPDCPGEGAPPRHLVRLRAKRQGRLHVRGFTLASFRARRDSVE